MTTADHTFALLTLFNDSSCEFYEQTAAFGDLCVFQPSFSSHSFELLRTAGAAATARPAVE